MLIKPRFPSLDEVTVNEEIVKMLLSCVRDDLCRKIEDINSDSRLSGDQIRLNIMLPLKGFFGRFIALRQFYWLGNYEVAEVHDRWKAGEGNCGMTWEEKRQLVYPQYEQPLYSLPLTSAKGTRTADQLLALL